MRFALLGFFLAGLGCATAPGKACYEKGIVYLPLNMEGQGRTVEPSVEMCQFRCKTNSYLGCARFGYWPDGGCHLQSFDAKPANATGWGASEMISGPMSCGGPLWVNDPSILDPGAAAQTPGLAAAGVVGGIVSGPPEKCPGAFVMPGFGSVALVPTGWVEYPDMKVGVMEVLANQLVPHMDARAYFASACTGQYDRDQYVALNLLGKRMKYSIDVSSAGCGCNAALYLVSMRQNPKESTCSDYYCDANSVCGVKCDEIDIMEANRFAFHSTLHTEADKSGKGGGFGGGDDGWNGPRDFGESEYGPGGRCVDTRWPFEVAVSFPTDGAGVLQAMEVTLTQQGKDCPLHIRVDDYQGMAALSKSLAAGMTPVVSYWSADDMLWLDGQGSDGRGPCREDDEEKCGDQVKMYGFSVESMDVGVPGVTATPVQSGAQFPAGPTWLRAAAADSGGGTLGAAADTAPQRADPPPRTYTSTTTTVPCSVTRKNDCTYSRCCQDPGMQCFEKHQFWAACQWNCTPGIDPRDPVGHRTPWSCKRLGERTPGEPLITTTSTTEEPTTTEPPPTTTFTTTTLECSETQEENCKYSRCCKDPGMQCYEKHVYWAECLWECKEGVDADPWTCNRLGSRTPGEPPITTTMAPEKNVVPDPLPQYGGNEEQDILDVLKGKLDADAPACSATRKDDCSKSHCCQDPGMQCYEKHEYWAACQIDCTPGIDPRDPKGHHTPWSCKRLGERTPGDPVVTTTSTTQEPVFYSDRDADREEEKQVMQTMIDAESQCAGGPEEDCTSARCCRIPGTQCYEQDHQWAACLQACTPGTDPRGSRGDGTPWSCRPLGQRNNADDFDEGLTEIFEGLNRMSSGKNNGIIMKTQGTQPGTAFGDTGVLLFVEASVGLLVALVLSMVVVATVGRYQRRDGVGPGYGRFSNQDEDSMRQLSVSGFETFERVLADDAA